jgi:acetyl-CoA acetyltransferase family protein
MSLFDKTYIPYGAYWSSPFCRWQGSFANDNAIKLAAGVARSVLTSREIDPQQLDGIILGMTVPQLHAFYGAPWLAAMIGAPQATGANIGQACATSARVVATAALEVQTGGRGCVLGVTCDRTSNGPHMVYPRPGAPGARAETEDWVWDNFNGDPNTGKAMIATAEAVAAAHNISKSQQDELTLLRHQQYGDALADDRAFQKRYMASVQVRKSRKKTITVDADEGVHATNADGLSKLRPVLEDGSVSFGTQTFPADGNAGIVICDEARAKALSRDANITVQVLSYGEARVDKGMMPMAVVPAAQHALLRAGIGIADCDAIKTHNPFAVNDVYFCQQLDVKPEAMNRYGSPLIYGHPQGPTGIRIIVELIEELALRGGGYGLFSGCAAGDSGMAIVLKVS